MGIFLVETNVTPSRTAALMFWIKPSSCWPEKIALGSIPLIVSERDWLT
jgi:hypothetical protein